MPDILPQEQIYQLLSTNGDGTGDVLAIGDYSSEMVEFFVTNPSRSLHISTMTIVIRDVGLFAQDRYGTLVELTKGIRVNIKNDKSEIILDMTGGIAIKSNAAWSIMAFDTSPLPQGPGDGFFSVRWAFNRESGSDIILLPGHRLSVELNDSFIGLIIHIFFVHGTFTLGG